MSNEIDKQMAKQLEFLTAEVARLNHDLALRNREIEVEKALEKVRMKAMDMRNSSELSETSIILFQQLKELKIDAIRTGVGIFDDENEAVELWITSVAADGSLFFVLDYINVHVHPVFEKVFESRNSKIPYVLTKLEGADLKNYYGKMSTYIGIPNRREDSTCEFYQSFFFSAGTINVVTNTELSREEKDIMLRMANVFGLLYTRFLDLKKSEEQALVIGEEKKILEETLDHLKATQSQLIQSEKMASLGQLTAGIAHEIQNPLNFVKNFSEVSNELLEEMKDELTMGNKQQAKDIADNVKDNLDKIIFHGKRADAIVKGMLMHSRTSTGVKEPADINALCDEYLRLAYHGMRAKDKTFNVTMKTDFDESIGLVNVVPQDIGRVILNLITNGFYAVSEKSKTLSSTPYPLKGGVEYNPTVKVITKKQLPPPGGRGSDVSGGRGSEEAKGFIQIIISDNGPGIPQHVLDKLFQPFFTTKPTGQGTGLGLSISYDIIKAHGGELKVETKEGEFAEFIITLPV